MSKHTHLADIERLCQTRLPKFYQPYLANIPEQELKNVMSYALSRGGKYIRPMLVYTTGIMFNAPIENLDLPASAVEIIHTYSLIHDDLPSMDNADLRRNHPTCHIKFSEGMALLAGDALQTLAFEILASHPASVTDQQRLSLLKTLTHATGAYGMAGGQAFDMMDMQKPISLEHLQLIYGLKTGALITASVELGAITAGNATESELRNLRIFADSIGLAFQIQDDILDTETSAHTGKTYGQDAQNSKNTFSHLAGVQVAKEKITQLYEQAHHALNQFGSKAQLLCELIHSLQARQL